MYSKLVPYLLCLFAVACGGNVTHAPYIDNGGTPGPAICGTDWCRPDAGADAAADTAVDATLAASEVSSSADPGIPGLVGWDVAAMQHINHPLAGMGTNKDVYIGVGGDFTVPNTLGAHTFWSDTFLGLYKDDAMVQVVVNRDYPGDPGHGCPAAPGMSISAYAIRHGAIERCSQPVFVQPDDVVHASILVSTLNQSQCSGLGTCSWNFSMTDARTGQNVTMDTNGLGVFPKMQNSVHALESPGVNPKMTTCRDLPNTINTNPEQMIVTNVFMYMPGPGSGLAGFVDVFANAAALNDGTVSWTTRTTPDSFSTAPANCGWGVTIIPPLHEIVLGYNLAP